MQTYRENLQKADEYTKTKQNPDYENLEEKTLSQVTLLIIYYDFNFSEFMRLKNPDRLVSLVIWSRVITSLPGYCWAIKCGQQYRMRAYGY